MNKKRYNELLRLAIKEHRIADYAKALLVPTYLQAMKKIGRQRFPTHPNADDKMQAITNLEANQS